MHEPYQIRIDKEILSDLRRRLAATRWIDEVDNDNWQAGTNKAYLQALCDYWGNGFNWEQQEAYLNTFHHYTTVVQGQRLHFIYEKGEGPHRIPLLLTHGYPDSFVRFLKLIPLLTKADIDGVSFDVVIPSIPGYGFSDKPVAPGMNPAKIATLFAALMKEELGYDTYVAHGGDWGSTITEMLARQHPEQVTAIHLTDIPFIHLFEIPEGELSAEEKDYLERGRRWQQQEGGYAMIQSTKPQTLGYGLNDSPAGLAAWIMEKFHGWSDHNGNLESVFSRDELLTNLTIYWATETIHSANRLYYETGRAMAAGAHTKTPPLATPTGVALFPKDLVVAPQQYGQRVFNIQRWTKFEHGGHFGAMEQPEWLAGEIRAFFSSLHRFKTQ